MNTQKIKELIQEQLEEVQRFNERIFKKENIISNGSRFQTWKSGPMGNETWSCIASNDLETNIGSNGIFFKSSGFSSEHGAVVDVLENIIQTGFKRHYTKYSEV